MRVQTVAGQVVFVLLIAFLWEGASRFHLVDPDLLPPLSAVLVTLWHLLHDPKFLNDLRVTALEVLVSYGAVVPIGLLVGFVLAETPAAARVANPVVHAMMAVPKSIFLPAFILVLGIGFAQKVVFGASLAFFVIVVYAEAAVAAVPTGFMTLARASGANRAQIYLRIYVPAMLPVIVAALRVGFIFVVTGVLLAEVYSASTGVGQAISYWGEYYKMKNLLAAVVLIVVVCVVVNQLFEIWERRVGMGRLNFGAVT